MMQLKTLTLEVKSAPDGTISGYGSVFSNLDQGGDIVAPGAFTDSLASSKKVRMLWQHDPYDPIGVWDNVSEDATGLKVEGRLLLGTAAGKNAYELVKAGAVDGLSIGFITVGSEDMNGARIITKADLWEVSVVTFPMNAEALITAVKASEMTKIELERRLTHDAKLSRSVARALMRDGMKGLTKQDAGAGLDELALRISARAILKRHML